MNNFFDNIKNDFDLCKYDNKKYLQKIDSISKLFNLTGKNTLMPLLPAGFTGRYDKKDQYIIFSLNPGYSDKFNPYEEIRKNKSWDEYVKFRTELYLFFKELDHPSKYYKAFWLLFLGLLDKNAKNYDKWNFFDQRLVNFNLIPYHSKAITLPNRLSDKQSEYLLNLFNLEIDFIIKNTPKLFIFNGNTWYNLLVKQNIIKINNSIDITPKFRVYFFKYRDIPCVLFDKFFSFHFWGVNNTHRNKTIPNIIKKEYPNIIFN